MARRERTRGLVNQSQANLWAVLGGIAAVLSLAVPLVTAGRDELSAPPGPPATSGPPASVPATSDASPSGPTGGVGELVFDGQVQLRYGEGIDVEVARPRVAVVDGPNGPIDLYYDVRYLSLRVNGGDVYAYQGTENGAWAGCRQIVADGKAGQAPGLIYAQGQQFCFRSSSRRTAWTRVNDWGRASEPYVVLDVKVWATSP